MTVRAEDASVQQLLDAIIRETGIQVSGHLDDRDTISIEIHDAPLVNTLAQILADTDCVIVGSSPIRVWVRSRRSGPPGDNGPAVPAPPDPETDQTEAPADAPEDDQAPAVSDSPLAPDPELRLLDGARFFEKAEPSALLDAAKSANAAVRERALRSLAEREPEATPSTVLPDAVADPDAQVSATASRLLDERTADDAIEQIGVLLHHRDPTIRLTAIELLRRRGDAAALAELRQAVDDPDEPIRMTAKELVAAMERELERRPPRPK